MNNPLKEIPVVSVGLSVQSGLNSRLVSELVILAGHVNSMSQLKFDKGEDFSIFILFFVFIYFF